MSIAILYDFQLNDKQRNAKNNCSNMRKKTLKQNENNNRKENKE